MGNTIDPGWGILVTLDSPAKSKQEYKTVSEHLKSANQELTDLYHALRDYMMNLGDDVQEKTLKYYFAYKRIKNFACVEVYTQSNKLQVYVKLNPDEVQLEEGFTRDVRNIGHFGTGDLEITIRNEEDLTKAEPLFLKSYEALRLKVKIDILIVLIYNLQVLFLHAQTSHHTKEF